MRTEKAEVHMYNNILSRISSEFAGLTKSGKALADYILKNKTSVQYMSITSLADASGVSEASITRFCRNLGLEGYNELKLSLAIAGSPMSENNFHSEEGKKGYIEETAGFLLKKNTRAMEETVSLMNRDAIEKAVRLLREAHRVLCFGQGGSNVTALEAWALFSTVSPKFIHISDSHFQAMCTALCGPLDVILFFSYSGATRELKDIIKISRSLGVKLILITRYEKTPASRLADVILQCGTNESPLQTGSVEARISQLFIIDYLYSFFCRDEAGAMDAREATAQATAIKLL
ncbi:MAG: MurR/RpiR family transcriptional regulator [Lachnospiraceae bacterium]|nr:MurR/RpiR family transcriptional regulator [Lachnospiraceae bacterium]